MIYLIGTQIDVSQNVRACINIFLLSERRVREDFIEAPVHLFPIPQSNIFRRWYPPLTPPPPGSIFNYDGDLPLFHRRAAGGCTPTCLALKEIVEMYTLLHFNIRNCCSISCTISTAATIIFDFLMCVSHSRPGHPSVHWSSKMSPSLFNPIVHASDGSMLLSSFRI